MPSPKTLFCSAEDEGQPSTLINVSEGSGAAEKSCVAGAALLSVTPPKESSSEEYRKSRLPGLLRQSAAHLRALLHRQSQSQSAERRRRAGLDQTGALSCCGRYITSCEGGSDFLSSRNPASSLIKCLPENVSFRLSSIQPADAALAIRRSVSANVSLTRPANSSRPQTPLRIAASRTTSGRASPQTWLS